MEGVSPQVGPAAVAPSPEVRVTQDPVRREFALEGAIIQGGAVVGTAPDSAIRLELDGQAIDLARDGRFLIAFDRDAAPTARLVAYLENGEAIEKLLTIAPRDWPIERVNAPLRAGVPSATFLRMRAVELEQINAARQVHTDSQGWRQRFIWPHKGRISGRFGSQRIYQGKPASYHSGVDVAGATGDIIVAPADGVVILASDQPFTLEGNLLMLDHGMGLNSAFLHLSRIDVKAGDHVRKGQPIAALGATGRATGPHMHWGLKWNDARIDPMLLAGPITE
ncbi:M23 family metallopeptidase [Rhizorhapis sp. SPR117]|uniref:M23 family metallopeptidase n=1 Tax=Rhizorhapis sp. SPR117 TaxID=2912611 RepID=UPI00403EC0F1